MKRLNLIFIFLVSCLFAQAQNIGIGTTTPDYTLDINGTLGVNSFIYHNEDDNADTWIGFPKNDEFEIVVGGKRMLHANGVNGELILNADTSGTRFIIVADGIEHLMDADPVAKTIGIGTSTPQYILDVKGDFRVIGDQIEHLFFVEAATGRVGINTATPTADLDVNGSIRAYSLNASDVFIVDAVNQRIGVNDTSPSSALDVTGEIAGDQLKIANNSLPFLETVQTGSMVSLFNEPGNSAHTVTVDFPQPFNSIPNVMATVHNISGQTEDSYFASVRVATQTQVIFNVGIYSTGGPADSLKLTWMAWE